jgi:hypothetical protein
MRQAFLLDWASAFTAKLEEVVEANFAHESHRWPLIRSCDVDGHVWRGTHLAMIFRDKLSGIPSVGLKVPLDHPDVPSTSPTSDNIAEWHSFLENTFNARPRDAVLIIPIVKPDNDPGMAVRVDEDWRQWSDADRQLWAMQVEMAVTQHFYYLKGFSMSDEFVLPPGYLFLADDCQRFFADHPGTTATCSS